MWRLQGDLTAAFQYLKGSCKKDGEKLFARALSDMTRGNGFRLKEERLRVDIQRKVRHCCPESCGPCLGVLRAGLDGALGN